MKLFNYLAITRPANIITAIADILAGVAIAGVFAMESASSYANNIFYLCLSTVGLYAGGIVFNDIFDVEIDKIERPERAIPRGIISLTSATIFGLILLLLGILAAFQVSLISAFIAVSITLFALLYDKFTKHIKFLGPLTMGLCRGLNLLLGMSVLGGAVLPEFWMISFLPIIFIFAITLTSQGEVHAKNKGSIIFALSLDFFIALMLVVICFYLLNSFWVLFPFIGLWFGMNFYAKSKAIFKNKSEYIMKAVKMGVISLIPLDACYVVLFGSWEYGLAVLLLLPLSMLLAKYFSVT